MILGVQLQESQKGKLSYLGQGATRQVVQRQCSASWLHPPLRQDPTLKGSSEGHMMMYLQRLENSCVKVEHSGKNEKRRRQWGWLQTRCQFPISGWTDNSPCFDDPFSGILHSSVFSPDLERHQRDMTRQKEGGKRAAHGCNYQSKTKVLPLAPRETRDLRL